VKAPKFTWILAAILLGAAVVLYWGLNRQAPLMARHVEPKITQKKAFLTAFLTPISFWGKVIDEKGNAVPGATVKFGANDNPNPMEQGSKYTVSANDRGLFSIRGIHGIALNVEVSKEGYYATPESRGGVNYVLKNNTDRPVPTSANPAVFVLRKKGDVVKLIYISERQIKVPKNGSPTEISLESGRAVPAGYGGLKIECWTEDEKKDAQGKYPWHCRVSVPGGGLLKREGNFNFQAPDADYPSYDDIGPPNERWSAMAERQYFVKTADGHFARVNLQMRTGGVHFVMIESYFNPTPGSQNLEYDPGKQASPR
jgi:hypothetical protein